MSLRFLAHRAASSLAILLVVSIAAFTFLEVAPRAFVRDTEAARPAAAAAPEQGAAGLAQTLPIRYLRWLKDVVSGDFGVTVSGTPVSGLIWERSANTLLLTIPAFLVSWAVALPVGMWAASRVGGLFDRLSAGGTAALTTPDLLLTLLFLLIALGAGWLPHDATTALDMRATGVFARIRELAREALLPVAALVVTTLPALIRHVRTCALEAGATPAIQAARAHGISVHRIIWRHILPMTAAPLVSIVRVSIATILSASLLVEVVLNWPGMGALMVQSLIQGNFNVIVAASMLATLFVVAGTLLAEATLLAIDPRLRRRHGRA